MRAHEYLPADERGRKWCKHCGTLWHALMDATCLERPDAEGPPSRPWRGSALDDIDAMHARLAELRREREAIEAANAAPELPLAANYCDGDCG